MVGEWSRPAEACGSDFFTRKQTGLQELYHIQGQEQPSDVHHSDFLPPGSTLEVPTSFTLAPQAADQAFGI